MCFGHGGKLLDFCLSTRHPCPNRDSEPLEKVSLDSGVQVYSGDGECRAREPLGDVFSAIQA